MVSGDFDQAETGHCLGSAKPLSYVQDVRHSGPAARRRRNDESGHPFGAHFRGRSFFAVQKPVFDAYQQTVRFSARSILEGSVDSDEDGRLDNGSPISKVPRFLLQPIRLFSDGTEIALQRRWC